MFSCGGGGHLQPYPVERSGKTTPPPRMPPQRVDDATAAVLLPRRPVNKRKESRGAAGSRTPNLPRATRMLCQLSYSPIFSCSNGSSSNTSRNAVPDNPVSRKPSSRNRCTAFRCSGPAPFPGTGCRHPADASHLPPFLAFPLDRIVCFSDSRGLRCAESAIPASVAGACSTGCLHIPGQGVRLQIPRCFRSRG